MVDTFQFSFKSLLRLICIDILLDTFKFSLKKVSRSYKLNERLKLPVGGGVPPQGRVGATLMLSVHKQHR